MEDKRLTLKDLKRIVNSALSRHQRAFPNNSCFELMALTEAVQEAYNIRENHCVSENEENETQKACKFEIRLERDPHECPVYCSTHGAGNCPWLDKDPDREDLKSCREECDHEWSEWDNSKIPSFDSRFCLKCDECDFLRPSKQYHYHSGKDALDNLMRGECDYIVFDDEDWQCKAGTIYRRGGDGYLQCGDKARLEWAIAPKYSLQTKWICLKDES